MSTTLPECFAALSSRETLNSLPSTPEERTGVVGAAGERRGRRAEADPLIRAWATRSSCTTGSRRDCTVSRGRVSLERHYTPAFFEELGGARLMQCLFVRV